MSPGSSTEGEMYCQQLGGKMKNAGGKFLLLYDLTP